MKIKFKFNKDKLIPNFGEYFKILLSSFIVMYLLKKIILDTFPFVANLSGFWALLFWVILITYIKGIFDFKIGKFGDVL